MRNPIEYIYLSRGELRGGKRRKRKRFAGERFDEMQVPNFRLFPALVRSCGFPKGPSRVNAVIRGNFGGRRVSTSNIDRETVFWKRVVNFIKSPEVDHAMKRRRGIYFMRRRVAYISISEIAGHGSFVLLAISFGFSDITWLRSLALLAGTSMAVFNYWHPHGVPLMLPLRWNMIFIGVNLSHLLYIAYQSRKANQLTDDEKKIREEVFANQLSAVDFMILLRAGRWVDSPPNTLLLTQGRANPHVMLVAEGEAQAEMDGRRAYRLQRGNFIGEMGLHLGLLTASVPTAVASVRVKTPMRCLVWDRATLTQLMQRRPDLGAAVQAALGHDLLCKLNAPATSSSSSSDASAGAEYAHRRRLLRSKYRSVLANVLQPLPDDYDDDEEEEAVEVGESERFQLARFRQVHHVSDADHERALRKLGWTVEEFNRGYQSPTSSSSIDSSSPSSSSSSSLAGTADGGAAAGGGGYEPFGAVGEPVVAVAGSLARKFSRGASKWRESFNDLVEDARSSSSMEGVISVAAAAAAATAAAMGGIVPERAGPPASGHVPEPAPAVSGVSAASAAAGVSGVSAASAAAARAKATAVATAAAGPPHVPTVVTRGARTTRPVLSTSSAKKE